MKEEHAGQRNSECGGPEVAVAWHVEGRRGVEAAGGDWRGWGWAWAQA